MNKPINKGYTLIETILSLLIITFSMSLLISTFPIIKKISKYDENISIEIGIKQIQELILLGNDFIFDSYEIRFYYMGKDVSLKIDKDRVVRTDGYLIYIENLSNAYFTQNNHCFFLNYNQEKRFLGCE